jgi:hypothetical protein
VIRSTRPSRLDQLTSTRCKRSSPEKAGWRATLFDVLGSVPIRVLRENESMSRPRQWGFQSGGVLVLPRSTYKYLPSMSSKLTVHTSLRASVSWTKRRQSCSRVAVCCLLNAVINITARTLAIERFRLMVEACSNGKA